MKNFENKQITTFMESQLKYYPVFKEMVGFTNVSGIILKTFELTTPFVYITKDDLLNSLYDPIVWELKNYICKTELDLTKLIYTPEFKLITDEIKSEPVIRLQARIILQSKE
jgi:hypothetical protein